MHLRQPMFRSILFSLFKLYEKWLICIFLKLSLNAFLNTFGVNSFLELHEHKKPTCMSQLNGNSNILLFLRGRMENSSWISLFNTHCTGLTLELLQEFWISSQSVLSSCKPDSYCCHELTFIVTSTIDTLEQNVYSIIHLVFNIIPMKSYNLA